MLARRLWLKSIALGTLACFSGRASLAQQGFGSNRGVPSLTDQLTKGLRATLPQQFEFVQVVVARVDDGSLPRGMVNLVYKWALERNPRYPFPYFQYALTELSKRRGMYLR